MDRSFANVRRTSKVGRGRKGTPSETPGEGVLAGGKHDNELQMQEQAARNAFDKVGAPERTTSCDVVSIRKKNVKKNRCTRRHHVRKCNDGKTINVYA